MIIKNDGAIHEDALEHEDGAIHEDAHSEEVKLSPREEAMERLAASREEKVLAEAGIVPAPDDTETAQEVPADPGTDQLVKVKIDGEEKEVPLADVVKGFQKETTASQRLEQAARERLDLDRRESDLLQREEQLKKQTAAPAAETASATGDAEYDTALDALLEGDREPMKALLKKGLETRPAEAAPISEADIDKVVEQRLTTRQREIDGKKANEQFAKDYADILADPDLLAAANKRYFAKVAEGKPIGEAMAEAGNETREWLESKAPKQLTTRELKEKRKGTIVNLPSAAARSTSAHETENAPENRSEVIKQMRKGRGLAV
jgi:predicted DNA binding protein